MSWNLATNIVFLAVVLPAAAGAATLSLDQSALSGAPDATVGWGFTITSTPVDDGGNTITPWLLITFADFVPDAGWNPVGVFTPYITQLPNSNTVIGPDDGNGEINPWSQSFDQGLMTGIGEYLINDFQSAGDEVTGTMVLDYDEYRVSPNDRSFDPDADTIATGHTMTAAASVSVTGDAPEPAGLWMMLGAGGLLGLLRQCSSIHQKPRNIVQKLLG